MDKYITGSDLTLIRKEARMTTTKTAEFAGVKTRKTYENWQRENGEPNINQFISILIGCGKDPYEYFKSLKLD